MASGIRGRVAMVALDTALAERTKAALVGWLGEQNAATVWRHKQRYIVILTIDMQGDPRYTHAIEFAPTIAAVIELLKAMTVTVQDLRLPSPGTPNACMVDTRLLLDSDDTVSVDAYLDGNAREFLLTSDAAGAA